MTLIVGSLAVFAITLLLTKSKIFAAKREYVQQRYIAAKKDGPVNIVHRIWHGWWDCPMCCGFWVAIPVAIFFPEYGIIITVLALFSLNWLLHCLENLLFFTGEIAKKCDEIKTEEHLKRIVCFISSQNDAQKSIADSLYSLENKFYNLPLQELCNQAGSNLKEGERLLREKNRKRS